ncbi:MAG: GDSL-type esterase/lipase family protein [Opitutaceae bacterium]
MNPRSFTPRLLALAIAAALMLSTGRTAEVAAPVPPPVTMARPSPAEVTKVTEDLKQFVAGADAGTQSLVAKFPELIAVRPPRANPAIVPALNQGFRARHDGFVAIAQKGDIDVLFMGDSITDWWRREGAAGVANPAMSGKTVFDQNFGTMKVANFGIAGDTTQGVLYRLQNGEGQGFQPKAIMLMIGTNNAANSSSGEIAEGVGAVVLELRKDFPAAKILLLGIFPRGNPGDAVRKTVADVNPIIAKLHDGKNTFYLDIGSKFLDADGRIPREIMGDLLHPTEKGYTIWAEAIKAPLADLLK